MPNPSAPLCTCPVSPDTVPEGQENIDGECPEHGLLATMIRNEGTRIAQSYRRLQELRKQYDEASPNRNTTPKRPNSWES